MLKSKWLSLVLNVNFMTLTILKLEFSSIFLESIMYLRASSQNFVENHHLMYFYHILNKFWTNHWCDHHLIEASPRICICTHAPCKLAGCNKVNNNNMFTWSCASFKKQKASTLKIPSASTIFAQLGLRSHAWHLYVLACLLTWLPHPNTPWGLLHLSCIPAPMNYARVHI